LDLTAPAVPTDQPLGTKILLVEDNKIDARLTRLALEKITDWPCAIEVMDDGEKALKFLRRDSKDAPTYKPDLVILDLNLPKYDGTEVLQFIRHTNELRNLLVFIFSSSPVDVAEDRMENANVKADGYFEKPTELSTYFSIALKIRESYQRAAQAGSSATA
jgi:CheY-like chemotaxis protein